MKTIEDWQKYIEKNLERLLPMAKESEWIRSTCKYESILLYAGFVSIAKFGNPKAKELAKALLFETRKLKRKDTFFNTVQEWVQEGKQGELFDEENF
jgi:hypothetical protein